MYGGKVITAQSSRAGTCMIRPCHAVCTIHCISSAIHIQEGQPACGADLRKII